MPAMSPVPQAQPRTQGDPLLPGLSANSWTLWTAILLIALAIALFVRGAEFYGLSVQDRVDHPDFRLLRPSAPVGHGYGIVGTILIMTNLTYLLRRRFAILPLGTMRWWLDMHVLCGLVGGMLVLFHSAFQLRTPIASLTAVSLILVIVSGVVGRYIFSLIPDPRHKELRTELDALDEDKEGLGTRIGEQLEHVTPQAVQQASLLSTVRMLPTWRAQLVARQELVDHEERRAALEWHPESMPERVCRRFNRIRTLCVQPVRAMAVGELLRAWRGMHRFTAMLLVVSVSVHIAVAWFFGFRWIFSD